MPIPIRSKLSNCEHGAILIFFAILAGVLIAMVALAIDLFIYSSQVAKYDRTAEQAALAALEAYLEDLENPSRTPAQAANTALARAREIISENLDNYFGSDLIAPSVIGTGAGLDNLGVNTALSAGRIVTGLWHFSETPESANCEVVSTPFRPCFEPIPSTNRASAFRIELSVPLDGRLGIQFSSLVPKIHKQFTSTAVASLLPRRAVFLVDLSPSIVRDTHTADSNGEYAFFVDPSKNTTCSAGWSSDLDALHQPVFDSMHSGPRVSASSTIHYQNEYSCYPISSMNEAFVVDNITPPQPLTSVLDAIHGALSAFQQRAVSADRVGIAGFDDEILSMRKMNMETPTASNTNFQTFLEATDVNIPFVDRKESFLFPRLRGAHSAGGIKLPAKTDIVLALTEARNMITSMADYEIADNLIFLITDGLGNCVNSPPSGGGGERCFYTGSNNAVSQAYVEQSIQEVSQIASELGGLGIRMHNFLIGDKVSPHKLVRKGDTGCMTDEAARFASGGPLLMVDGTGSTFNSSNTSPYFFPNMLYQSSRITRGLWIPIVDCCKSLGSSSCSATAEDDIEAMCSSAAVPFGDLIPCVGGSPAIPCVSNWVDNSARLRCDPQGRSKQEQVVDAMNDIMSQNPFILVQ